MSRLIDADALIENLRNDVTGKNLIRLYNLNGFINAQPTVDAVPVVRCKDCKHSDTFPVCGEPYLFPLKCLSIRYGGVFEDWFCEHGERR